MRIERWLQLIARIAGQNYALAVEIADCQQLVKGYGETHDRGTANLGRILQKAQSLQGKPGAADQIASMGLGLLLMGVMAARIFGQFHGGNSPVGSVS